MIRERIKLICGIAGGVLAFCLLGFVLMQVVIGRNGKSCKDMGLDANIQSCSVVEDYAYDRITLVVGNTANSPKPVISDEAKKYINNSLFKNREKLKINIYSATPSKPRMKYKSKVKLSDGENLKDISEKLEVIRDEINEAISEKPSENGVDYYNAIYRAGKELSRAARNGKKTLLIIMGSGLSDTGSVDFANNGIPEDYMAVIDQLREQNEIDDDALDGVKVVWSYMGDVSLPQTRLSVSENGYIEGIYENLIEEMGSELIIDPEENGEAAIETNYVVDTTLTKDSSISWGTKDYAGDDTVLSFKSDSSELKNRKAAVKELEDLAIELNTDASKKVYITSYQSTVCGHEGEHYKESLLNDRSNTIKKILKDMGVSDERIISGNGGFGGSKICNNAKDRRVTISVKGRKNA